MKLLILGMQGSGKGTQSKLIAEKFKLKHISTGDLFREEMDKKSKEGKEISRYISKGNLVPDELTNKVLQKNLPKDNFILDGYPRNLLQAGFLEKISKPDKILYIELSEKEMVRRLSLRYQCKKCNILYGANKMPKRKGFCDICNKTLEKRIDDNEEAIKQRINIFNKETLPLINFYKDKLIRINGEQSVEDVFEDIKKDLL